MAKHWSEKRGWTWFPRQLRYTQPMQKGRDVKRWQTFLLNMHCGPRHIDGIFGPDTEACSRKYLVRMGYLGGNSYCIVKRHVRYRLYLMWWLFERLYPKAAPVRMSLPQFESKPLYNGAGKDAVRIMKEMGIDLPPEKKQ